ncbi:hypothetical protein ACWDTP_30830 [Mycobacterium sp. NPDC003449]
MSIWSDFLWTPQFITGSFVSGVLASGFTYVNTKASDKRSAEHDKEMQDRRDEREDKLRRERDVYDSATEFAAVCSDILTNSIDMKGTFNAIRDMFYNRIGAPDPKAEDKMAEGLKQAEATMRIATPFNKLKMVASGQLLASATQLNVAIMTVLRTTVEPFAKPVALKTASEALDAFVNDFREECGRERYSNSEAQRDAQGFLENLKKQVDAYMEEAKAEMKAAGFKDSPWGPL